MLRTPLAAAKTDLVAAALIESGAGKPGMPSR